MSMIIIYRLCADVQNWLDQSSTNSRWIIIGNESENKTTKTPEENGHVESLHKIQGGSFKNNCFNILDKLIQRLIIFYSTYNNKRHHGLRS